MERTGLSHAQIDEHAELTLVACYEHPAEFNRTDIELAFPTKDVIEETVGRAFNTSCHIVDSSILATGSDFESWISIGLKESIFKYDKVEKEFRNLEDEFDIPATLSTETSRIIITNGGEKTPDIPPFSHPTVVYEAHVNYEMPCSMLEDSLSNIETTFCDFDYDGRHSDRVDIFIGDRNIIYACTDSGRSGFNDAKRISKLIDSMFSSKGIQYNGVFVSMFDSPRQKEL